MALSTGLVLVMILAAWLRYRNYQPGAPTSTFIKLLENKWYVDELYQKLVVQPLFGLAGWLRSIVEAKGIDGLVNGVGRAVQYSARQLRLVQSGQVGLYVLLMVLAMALMLLIQFFIRK
jgi:NADH-quinone oxidoreductase subunit L